MLLARELWHVNPKSDSYEQYIYIFPERCAVNRKICENANMQPSIGCGRPQLPMLSTWGDISWYTLGLQRHIMYRHLDSHWYSFFSHSEWPRTIKIQTNKTIHTARMLRSEYSNWICILTVGYTLSSCYDCNASIGLRIHLHILGDTFAFPFSNHQKVINRMLWLTHIYAHTMATHGRTCCFAARNSACQIHAHHKTTNLCAQTNVNRRKSPAEWSSRHTHTRENALRAWKWNASNTMSSSPQYFT